MTGDDAPPIPRLVPASDAALLAVLAAEPSESATAAVLALREALAASPPPGLVDLRPAYTSLLVVFDPRATTHGEIERAVTPLLPPPGLALAPAGRTVEIPVCYEGEYGARPRRRRARGGARDRGGRRAPRGGGLPRRLPRLLARLRLSPRPPAPPRDAPPPRAAPAGAGRERRDRGRPGGALPARDARRLAARRADAALPLRPGPRARVAPPAGRRGPVRPGLAARLRPPREGDAVIRVLSPGPPDDRPGPRPARPRRARRPAGRRRRRARAPPREPPPRERRGGGGPRGDARGADAPLRGGGARRPRRGPVRGDARRGAGRAVERARGPGRRAARPRPGGLGGPRATSASGAGSTSRRSSAAGRPTSRPVSAGFGGRALRPETSSAVGPAAGAPRGRRVDAAAARWSGPRAPPPRHAGAAGGAGSRRRRSPRSSRAPSASRRPPAGPASGSKGSRSPRRPVRSSPRGSSPGAVQVPPGGLPIVLLVEHPSTGGYPKIASVISADLSALAQLRPGDEVRFAPVSFDEARRLLLEREARLAAPGVFLP